MPGEGGHNLHIRNVLLAALVRKACDGQWFRRTIPNNRGSVFAGTLGQDRLVEEGLIFDHQNDGEIADMLHKAMSKHFSWVEQVERFTVQRSYDAYTDDGRGVVKSFAELPGLILASGWSSGGIKSAPAVARRVSRLVLDRISSLVGV